MTNRSGASPWSTLPSAVTFDPPVPSQVRVSSALASKFTTEGQSHASVVLPAQRAPSCEVVYIFLLLIIVVLLIIALLYYHDHDLFLLRFN